MRLETLVKVASGIAVAGVVCSVLPNRGRKISEREAKRRARRVSREIGYRIRVEKSHFDAIGFDPDENEFVLMFTGNVHAFEHELGHARDIAKQMKRKTEYLLGRHSGIFSSIDIRVIFDEIRAWLHAKKSVGIEKGFWYMLIKSLWTYVANFVSALLLLFSIGGLGLVIYRDKRKA